MHLQQQQRQRQPPRGSSGWDDGRVVGRCCRRQQLAHVRSSAGGKQQHACRGMSTTMCRCAAATHGASTSGRGGDDDSPPTAARGAGSWRAAAAAAAEARPPRGGRSPVLVLPGFLADATQSERSLMNLRTRDERFVRQHQLLSRRRRAGVANALPPPALVAASAVLPVAARALYDVLRPRECSSCRGLGSIACDQCGGRGQQGLTLPGDVHNTTSCRACGRTGRQPCKNCCATGVANSWLWKPVNTKKGV